jgi:chromosome segregation ATPase
MQSIQIAYEKSKSTAHKLGVENDTLKQQMKFLRERFAEIGDLKTEKETLEVALAESRRNLEAALTQLQAGKANEQALQNNLTNVTRKLEEANVQKVDVLEQNGDMQEKVCSQQKELTKMRKEAEELRQRPQVSELDEMKATLIKAEEENKLLSDQVKAAEGRADLPARVADLTFKLEDLTRTAAAKDVYIGELTSHTTALSSEMETLRTERAALAETNATLRAQSLQKHSQSTKRMSLLNKQIEDMEKARTAAVAESERHLQLLKEQLRRTANDVNKREHPASNLLEKKLNIEEAIAEVRLKFERRMAKEAEGDDEEAGDTLAPEDKIERLEKEIEYHVKDIVLYKLDVKGYRKDLKRAKEKIAALTEVNTNVSPRKEKRSSISTPTSANSSPTQHRNVDSVTPSPATPSIATALHVQLPVRHIVSAYAAPMEIKAPMVSA